MKHYTTVQPADRWKVFSQGRIFKGGGSSSSPKMVGLSGPRGSDFDIRIHPTLNVPYVYPNEAMGLSFSGSVERLQNLGISGEVWELSKETMEKAKNENGKGWPDGLIINYRHRDHPLINVSEPMPVVKAILLLNQLGELMRSTGVRITPRQKVGT